MLEKFNNHIMLMSIRLASAPLLQTGVVLDNWSAGATQPLRQRQLDSKDLFSPSLTRQDRKGPEAELRVEGLIEASMVESEALVLVKMARMLLPVFSCQRPRGVCEAFWGIPWRSLLGALAQSTQSTQSRALPWSLGAEDRIFTGTWASTGGVATPCGVAARI